MFTGRINLKLNFKAPDVDTGFLMARGMLRDPADWELTSTNYSNGIMEADFTAYNFSNQNDFIDEIFWFMEKFEIAFDITWEREQPKLW